MNLYAFVLNDPLRRIDLFGLWTMPNQKNYDFLNARLGEYANFGLHNSIRDFMQDHTRVNGAFRTFGGLSEMSMGIGWTIATEGWGAVLGGGAIALHGLDQFSAGLKQFYTGQRSYSYTEQLLQKTGMSPEWSSTFDSSLSTLGSFGAIVKISIPKD